MGGYMFSKFVTVVAANICLLSLLACAPNTPPAPVASDTRAADEAAVREISAKRMKAIAARDFDAIESYYADDGWQLPNNGPIARTPEERRAYWKQIEALPIASDGVDVQSRVELAASGDLAVEYGEFRQIITDKTGASTSVPQKFVRVWRKVPGSTWKVSAGMATVEN
jgi:ketosteroid isomerase-like protein